MSAHVLPRPHRALQQRRPRQFEPWYVGATRAGFLHRDFLPTIAARPDLFGHRDGGWYLDAALDTPDQAHGGDARLPARACASTACSAGCGARSPIRSARTSTLPLLLEMERAAVPWFGVRAFGPHMTGYVQQARRPAYLGAAPLLRQADLPRRARQHRRGRPAGGHRPLENLIKECAEEAAIPRALAEQAKAVCFIAYWNQSGRQLKPDVMTCFDLELPEDFTPHAHDGEVHSFELWPVERVFETVRDTTEFKYNCNLVLIDFFVRHGLLRGRRSRLLRHRRGLRRSSPDRRELVAAVPQPTR